MSPFWRPAQSRHLLPICKQPTDWSDTCSCPQISDQSAAPPTLVLWFNTGLESPFLFPSFHINSKSISFIEESDAQHRGIPHCFFTGLFHKLSLSFKSKPFLEHALTPIFSHPFMRKIPSYFCSDFLVDPHNTIYCYISYNLIRLICFSLL